VGASKRLLGWLTFTVMVNLDCSNAIAHWPVEFQTGVFQVHADYDPQSLREPVVLASLASLPQEIREGLGIQVRAGEVHLILFQRFADYRDYMKKHFPQVVPRQAMFIRRNGPGMVFAFQSNQLATDLRHESTHAMLNASLPYVPLWLDEGLAEYFEVPAPQRLTEHPHHAATSRRNLFSRPPEIVDLEGIDTLGKMDAESYRKAWSIVHFLLHESPESKSVLQRFLGDLQVHSPPGQFSRRLETELPDWRKRYSRHFR
jgi:hypothetical protein